MTMQHKAFWLVLLTLSLIAIGCATEIEVTPTPEPLTSFLDRAEAAIAERRYGDAIQTLEQATLIHPQNSNILVKIGQIYLVQHRWLLAEDAFNRAIAQESQNVAAISGLAETMLNQRRFKEALPVWQQAAEIAPQFPGVFTGWGRAHLQLLNFDAAQATFLRQLEQSSDAEALWYLAALTASSDVEQALDYLGEIAEAETGEVSDSLLERHDYLLATLKPFTPQSDKDVAFADDVAKATGIALAQVELWPLALHALKQAQVHHPNDAETLIFLGHTQAQVGRPALDLFAQARSLTPDSILPLYFEAIYLRQQGALQAATAKLEQAVAVDADNAAAYVELGIIQELQGNLTAAEIWYLKAASVAEEDPQIQRLPLRFYANYNFRTSEAGIPLAERLIATNQADAELYDLLGWMQFLSGDVEEGEAALRQALELNPDLISARFHLARLLETNGQPLDAGAEYQKVIDWETVERYRPQALKDLQRLKAQYQSLTIDE